jgi:hypothetical protein
VDTGDEMEHTQEQAAQGVNVYIHFRWRASGLKGRSVLHVHSDLSNPLGTGDEMGHTQEQAAQKVNVYIYMADIRVERSECTSWPSKSEICGHARKIVPLNCTLKSWNCFQIVMGMLRFLFVFENK